MKPDGDYWDKTAQQWREGAADREYRLWRRHTDAVNERLLTQWLPPDVKRVLKTDMFDEAVGEGLVHFFERRGAHVVGIDVSPEVLVSAGARSSSASRVAADVRQLPFVDGSFDCVISFSTLDHFTNLDEIALSVRELGRTLRPGGTLVLTMDNPINPLVWMRNVALFPILHRLGIVPYFVGKTCGPGALRRIVNDAGMDVQEVGALLHCPRVIAVAVSKKLLDAQESTKVRFLNGLMKFEGLSRWPLRYFSGHFVALRAVKR